MTTPSSAMARKPRDISGACPFRCTRRSGWNQRLTPRSQARSKSQRRTSPTRVVPGRMTSEESARRARVSVSSTIFRYTAASSGSRVSEYSSMSSAAGTNRAFASGPIASARKS